MSKGEMARVTIGIRSKYYEAIKMQAMVENVKIQEIMDELLTLGFKHRKCSPEEGMLKLLKSIVN